MGAAEDQNDAKISY